MDNYFDWINLIGTLAYSTGLFSQSADVAVKVYNVIILILVFYRGFSFLRIFEIFTTLIGMVKIIIRRLTVFFLLLGYVYLCSSILVIKLTGTGNLVKTFGDVYYWIVLASIEDNAFDRPYSAIPIVLGSMFVTIVLLNILIAYLSNLFSRLEEQQKVQELKERAALILDLEVLIMFFKYGITGKNRLRREFEIETYKMMLKGSNYIKDIDIESRQKSKTLEQYLRAEQYLYIFKQVDLEKDLTEENIYQKINSIDKSIEELGTLFSKRSRIQESNMDQVFQMVKSSSSSQEKTIDDLKKLMRDNSTNVYENTENMLEKIHLQQQKIESFLQKIEEVEKQTVANNMIIQKLRRKIK